MGTLDEILRNYADARPFGSVTEWIEERTEAAPQSLLRVAEAHLHFAFWCKKRGFAPISVNAFARQVYALGVRATRNSEARYFDGMRLKREPDTSRPPPAAAPAPVPFDPLNNPL